MRVGVLLLPTDPWPETVDHVRRLEVVGFDHLWVYDHLSWQRYQDRPWHATVPWLAGVAMDEPESIVDDIAAILRTLR